MSLTNKQRDWVRRRDEKMCRFPVWDSKLKKFKFCPAEGQEVHHIRPNRACKVWFGKTFDTPNNLILLCKNCHQHRIHPDVVGALRLYRTNKNSFKLMFQERDRLVKMGRPYWITAWDILLLRIAKTRTSRYLKQHPDDPFPY